MEQITIALDWTPNTNHTGFFVADKLGFYTTENITLKILHPGNDDYAITPAKKLELQQVDFAIAPTESVISLNTKPIKVKAKAVAALLQQDISAIVTLKNSGIKSPCELDGKIYASYRARYEDGIVRKMIMNDGGYGKINITYPEKLGIWNTLLNGDASATWIFMNWEGIEAEIKNIPLNIFKLSDYNIPYSYSPVIMALENAIEANKEKYKAFLRATKKGFIYAMANPAEAAKILSANIAENEKSNIDILKSQLYTNKYYGNQYTWGKMYLGIIQKFIDWLVNNNLEDTNINATTIFTNDLID